VAALPFHSGCISAFVFLLIAALVRRVGVSRFRRWRLRCWIGLTAWLHGRRTVAVFARGPCRWLTIAFALGIEQRLDMRYRFFLADVLNRLVGRRLSGG